eukprot:6263064-Prymnesium_polylepis.2
MMGRARAHTPKLLKKEYVYAVQSQVDLDATDEVIMCAYMTKNIVHGTRAADEWLLDWLDVTEHAAGLAAQHQAPKNNKEQRDRVKPLHRLQGTTIGQLRRGENGKLLPPADPVELLLHAKALQVRVVRSGSAVSVVAARDAGVGVDELDGPVYADYKKVSDLPAGATLVRSDKASASASAPALVCIVTRAQEEAGLMYNCSQARLREENR